MSKKEKAPKMTKEEKKEYKLQKKAEKNTPENAEVRQNVIKAVTAVICVGILSLSVSGAMDKYCEAVKAEAEAAAKFNSLQVVQQNNGGASNNGGSSNSGTSFEVPADNGGTVADDNGTSADNGTPADNGSTTPDSGTPADNGAPAASDPTSFNKAQVVDYYNKCLKDAYSKKVKMTKTETINIKVDEASGGNVVVNFVNDTILPKYAGTKTEDRTLNGTKDDLEQRGPNFASPYRLDAANAKTATITKSGSNYLITIVTVPEKSTLENPPKINSTCAHPLDLATVDIKPAKVTKADFTYPGTTLKAIVDPSGKVLQTSINQPLSGTGEGQLGLKLHATLSGSLDQTVKYAYL